jgi:uncharacterized membrane protein YedE/YeeE
MKYLKFIAIGFFFGIIMYKSQAISWFRIHEMFRFESFHMFGIIGSALILGIGMVQLIKRKKIKNIHGEEIQFTPKAKSITRYLFGGGIFGLGWALAGACPGSMYVLIGSGAWSVLIVLGSAIIGTFLYGLFRKNLPH